MSYSFQIRARSKAEAAQQIQARYATIVEQQSAHQRDAADAEAAALAMLALIGEPPEGNELSVSINGSIGIQLDTVSNINFGFCSAHIGLSA